MIDREHVLPLLASRSSRTLPWLAVLHSDRTIDGDLELVREIDRLHTDFRSRAHGCCAAC